MNSRHAQRGFGLLEILITLVVLGVGLIAIANLQGKLFQNSSDARDRAAAANLAQQKLEDLRTFMVAGAGGAAFGFSEIGNNTGGMRENGALLLPAGQYPIGNNTYTLSWTANGFSYGSDDTAAGAPAAGTTPSFMNVTVTVTWQSGDGSTDTQTLTSNISSATPTSGALTLVEPGDRGRPKVPYVPTSPDDLSIDVGDGDKVSKTPDPRIRQGGQNPTPIVEIIEVFVNEHDIIESMSEYLTLACTCAPDGSGEAYDPTVKRLEEDANRLHTVLGEEAAKQKGNTHRAGNFSQQAALCDTCCRDHHDRVGAPDKYSPFRTDGVNGSGNHPHYFPDNGGNLQPAGHDGGGIYLEACRIERHDGYLRVTPDWHLASLQIMPVSYLVTHQAQYQSFVQDFVKQYVLGIGGGNYPAGYQPPALTFPPEEWTLGLGLSERFVARGIYISPMDASLVAEIKSRIGAGEPFLGIVPFNDVNLTKFVNWASLTDAGTPAPAATVTNQSLADGGSNERGLVSGLAIGTANIEAVLANDNTGLTNTVRIDPGQPDAEFYRRDVIRLTVQQDAPPTLTIQVSGTITGQHQALGNLNVNKMIFEGGGAHCYKRTDGQGGNASYSFQCALDPIGNGILIISDYNRTQGQGVIDYSIVADALPPGTIVTVLNHGTPEEETRFQFVGVAEDLVMNLSVE